MEYDDIEDFQILTVENVNLVKGEVDFVTSRFQKMSAMLHGLRIMHEDRTQLKAKIHALSGEQKRDMDSINISDPKKRKVLEDALGKYYEGERRDAEYKLSELNDALQRVDQDVRQFMKLCSGVYNFA